ncbi:cytochrome c oxidase assembly protein [Paramicrobacterium chengjingii]|uniref:Cytochrome c oxidase assembly protein n=1 Tax=Paramicrobacterium chengjingii TaxID=2769067 RepID=A0ABX6YGR0_9MICO|nr:cytochrome c oxidase assembly protein [Microbacterium chengjingii]QPZ37973.1 cytochrome c oxidase assembly protein [Microbacterium chengjingii]
MQLRLSDATASAAAAPVIHRSRGLIGAVSVLSLAVLLAFPVATAVLAGDAPYTAVVSGFPGLDVAVATTIAHTIAGITSTATVGALVALLFLRDARGTTSTRVPTGVGLTVLRVASAIWSVTAGALVVLEAADANGVPLSKLNEPGAFAYLYSASDHPIAWTFTFVLAGLVCVASQFATRWTSLLIPLAAAVLGLLAPAAVGQLLVGQNHDLGGDSGYLLTIAAAVHFGVLIVAAARVATGQLMPPRMLKRFTGIVAVSLAVMIVTDPIVSLFKLSGTGILDSMTGWQVIARSAVLLVDAIVIAVLVLRLRSGRLTDRTLTTSFALAGLCAAAWTAVDVAISRIPPPNYFQATSIAEVYMGFNTPDAPTPLVLFTHWRINILFVAIAIAAIAVYLIAARTLRKRGDAWPVGRTIAWITGWAIVVFITSSGFGRYSAPDFAIHMIVHMTLNMLAPMFLVLGGVVTLLLRASKPTRTGPAGPHEWISRVLTWKPLQLIFNPLLVFIGYIASYYALYFSPIFGDYMRFHWAHQLMNVHFLVIGYLFYSLVIGVDRPPRPLPHIGKLGYVLAAMPFHAFFGVILMTSNDIVAETFYRYLDMPWANLAASQYAGGGIAWAGGEIPLMIVIVVLAVQWSRQDGREAKRVDRHIDTGRDDEFDDYNAMLASLRDRQPSVGPSPQTENADAPGAEEADSTHADNAEARVET